MVSLPIRLMAVLSEQNMPRVVLKPHDEPPQNFLYRTVTLLETTVWLQSLVYRTHLLLHDPNSENAVQFTFVSHDCAHVAYVAEPALMEVAPRHLLLLPQSE